MMLVPPSAVQKSATYAVELEKWAQIFPPSQLMIINTDDMSSHAQHVMNETFAFIGIPPVDVGQKTRFCVRGKAGAMSACK